MEEEEVEESVAKGKMDGPSSSKPEHLQDDKSRQSMKQIDDTESVPFSLTQSYLKLLHSGKLASKKKEEFQSKIDQTSPTRRLDEPRSVFDLGLNRMGDTTRSLDVAPIIRPASSSCVPRRSSSPSPLQRSASAEFRVAQLSQPVGKNPHKVFTPGPGAYSPATDRFGMQNSRTKFSFGSAIQRPDKICSNDAIVSPGPVYLPQRTYTSTISSPPRSTFGRREIGSRCDPNAGIAHNHPHFNPGPGLYRPVAVYKGGKTETGGDSPRVVFGNSQKLISPEKSFSGTVFISKDHARRENMSIHSPGPSVYSPKQTVTKQTSNSFTLAAKVSPSYFDVCLDPERQQSPGPVYLIAGKDRRGVSTWGDEPKATFGKAGKTYEPEVNLNATAFVSKMHAMHSNQAVHSPGPIYFPSSPKREKAPSLGSGPTDRFYDRFELGRLG